MTAPDESIAIEPITLPFVLEWNSDLIRAAERQADAGYLRLAADLCEAMLADDRVQGVLRTRIRGLLLLPVSFEPGLGRRKGVAVRALEAEEDWWAMYPEDALGSVFEWGTLFGIGYGSQAWRRRPNGRVIGTLTNWNPRWLRFDWTSRTWSTKTAGQGDVAITPGDGRWLLYAPYGLNRPWAGAPWRALARLWLLKQYAIRDWAAQGERARGLLAAKPPIPQLPVSTGSTSDASTRSTNRQRLVEELSQLAANAAIVLPAGYDLSCVTSPANTWQTYQAQTQLADAGIAILLAGQNLTTQVEGGSFAAATVHQYIRGDLIAADAELGSSATHDQGLVWWAEYNFGDRDLAPWAQWPTTPPEDLQARSALWKATADAADAWERLGVPVDKRTLAERVGMPLLDGPIPSGPAPLNGQIARS